MRKLHARRVDKRRKIEKERKKEGRRGRRGCERVPATLFPFKTIPDWNCR
jgi:hypothetical protein